jgi:hypothetical protein
MNDKLSTQMSNKMLKKDKIITNMYNVININ